MTHPVSLKFLDLPPMDQFCLVVPDLDGALALYEPLFGPFMVLRNGPFDSVYRGQPARVELAVAFGRAGDIEVELVEWISGNTPHRDFLQQGRQGVQHIRYQVDDINEWVEKLLPLGYTPVWSGSFPGSDYGPGMSWCYLEREADPLMLEFVRSG